MNSLIERVKSAMVGLGTGWILVLMLLLSVISLAIMLERAWLYWSLRDDIDELMRDLGRLLRGGDLPGARRRLEASRSAEAAVVVAGLVEADRGVEAAQEAMEGASALQRLKLEKRLAYLGTLGNNAPFIGLLGTVIGIVAAFDELSKVKMAAASGATQLAPEAVMARISEALVATAIGILIAIPAVAAFNAFQRVVRGTLANTDALGHLLLAHLKATPVERRRDRSTAPDAPKAERASSSGSRKDTSGRLGEELSDGRRRGPGGGRGDHRDQRHPAGRHHARAPHHLHGHDEDRAQSDGAARSAEGGDRDERRAGRLQHHHGGRRAGDGRRQASRTTTRSSSAPGTRRSCTRTCARSSRPTRRCTHGRVIHVLDLLKQAHVNKIAFGVTPAPPAGH